MSKGGCAKIKTVDQLAVILGELKKRGKRIVHCHGVFDLLHPGHIRHLQAAKSKGDVLVVTVTADRYVNRGPGRPVFKQALRTESLAAIACVDFVAINEAPVASEAIKKLKPALYIKGSDYAKKAEDLTGKIYEEEQAVKSVGGQLDFTDDLSFSSTSLINTYLAPYPEEAKEFLLKFKKSHNSSDIINLLKQTKDVKVLVIGDIIIDEYHYCQGIGKPQKDNIIATKFLHEETFAGGALAAANHLAGFCQEVTLLSCVGMQNNYNHFIATHLRPNIKTKFYYRLDVPTVIKRRFVDPDFLTKLFEICHLEDGRSLAPALEQKICNYLEAHLRQFDLVLIADFGHGLITPKIVKAICKGAKFLALNVQTNSANIGFNHITKFTRADYICIDEPELRLACHDRFSDLKKLILKINRQLRCKKIIITKGHRGSLVYSKQEGFWEIPVFSKEVVDRIGAGDAYFSITAPCVFKGGPMQTVGFVGNAVGAMKVLIVGNRSSVEPVPLFKYISALLK